VAEGAGGFCAVVPWSANSLCVVRQLIMNLGDGVEGNVARVLRVICWFHIKK
jgi:hypothetical protein